MKRATIILALLCAIAICVVCQPPNDKGVTKGTSASNASQHSEADHNQQHATSPLPNGITINNQSIPQEYYAHADHTEEDIAVQRQLAKFTEYLVMVGLLQAVVFYFTLRKIGKQADIMGEHATHLENLATAAGDNAKAAEKTAAALILGDRAWALIEKTSTQDRIEDPYLPTVEQRMAEQRVACCVFYLRNYGKTPAKIIGMKAELQVGESPSVPPDASIYSSKERFTIPDILPQDTSYAQEARFKTYPEEQAIAGIQTGTKFLWLCGTVRYVDIFEMGAESEHKTRFCYLWETRMDTPKPVWMPAGPREYHETT